jgi:hypothetical protein|tara:strand:+ start:58821 stop:59267 length:447 start_codon:yes stop_codon:yes gene_type:complete
MYKRHDIWDEGKWDIHSTSGTGGDYAGHSSKGSQEDYHKNDEYNANKPEEDKVNKDYKSMKKEDEDKKKEKENEEKEKTIADAVEQEEKYQKKEQEEKDFNSITKDIQNNNIETGTDKDKNMKKKKNKSIEEAIKEAIREEKEIVHVD